MNLGDASLRFVNTSRPQLVHTTSKQSVTVSDDYHSLASDASSSDDRATVLRYQTPPSQMRSPDASRDTLQSEATIPLARPVTRGNVGHNAKPSAVSFEEGETTKSKSVTVEGPTVKRGTNETSPPTPGVDDTPYIRFAIDQLTRDEELLGRGRQGAASEDSYPARTIVPDKGLSHRSTGHDRQASDIEIKRPVSSPAHNVLIPAEPDEDSLQYPRLNFVPRPLRLLFLTALIFCCLFMMVGLVFCNVWSSRNRGLLQYDGVGTSRYFLFQYLPQLLAILIIIPILIIQSAVQRTLPFTIMASGRSTQNSGILHGLALFPTNFLIPNLAFFKYKEPLLGLCYMIFWLSLFTVPLQSSFFQTRYYSFDGQNVWRWTAVQPVGWTLLGLYLLLAVALMLLLLRFSRRNTGLRWDSKSLADVLVLLHRSNILSDFAGSEVQRTSRRAYASKKYRLGYWTTSGRSDEAFHSVGEANAPDHGYALARGGKAKATYGSADPENFDLEGQRPIQVSRLDSLQTDIHSPAVRYRWTPWFLRDTFVVAWIVIAVVLMIAFVVVSLVNHAVENGFLPLLPSPTTTEGFSPANFLYSFLPSLLGMILFLVWQPIDLYFRALQPFASLSDLRGTTAENCLLLDYTSRLPVEVTIKAALAGHYKVAWISFISLLSITLPVLSGGVFTAQFFMATEEVRIAASMPGYEALVFFAVVYALSFLVIWPTRKRYLPHDISTLGQLISFIYQSPLLKDDAFQQPRTRVDLVTRLLGPSRGEHSSPKYAFGVYVGNDGTEHLGIDRLQRPGSGEMLITTGTMR